MLERGQAEESQTSGNESSSSESNDSDDNDDQPETSRQQPEPAPQRQEVQRPTPTRRKSIAKRSRPSSMPSRPPSPKRRREIRSKNVHDPSTSTAESSMIREIRSLKTHVIGLERDLSELRRSSSAQTAALMEQTALLRKQNNILRSEMKKLRKEVSRLSKNDEASSSEDSETSDDESDDDKGNDESSDDSGSDNNDDGGADDQTQATEPPSGDSESEHEEQKESSSDSEATESQQRSESQSESAEEDIEMTETAEMPETTEIPETETTAAAEPEKLSDVQILDAQSNIATFTVRQLKDFLKRHGWTSIRLNKASIDTMRSEAVKIQLDLVQLLPEGTASAVERDMTTTASVVSLERTLHPRQMPQPSKHRIVHWRFDSDKDCYMIKRITGDTQFFYSTYDLTKLKEEDLRELTDLNLQNDHHNSRAYAFEKFLKKIKRENFDGISKTKKKIMKPKTRKYLENLGITKEKMLEEQFLKIKPDQVPTPNDHNLLENFTRWYLDEKTYEMVIEREEEEEIRVFHSAELNQFSLPDLETLASYPPEGKKEWNKDLIEFMWKTAIRLFRRYEATQPSTTKTTAPAPPTT